MPTTLVDNVPFRHNLSGSALKEALARIASSRCTAFDLHCLLEKSIRVGDAAGAEDARKMLAANPASILCSSIAANKKLKPSRRQSLERCLEIPKDLDFTSPFPEVVQVYPKAKKSGGFRMVHKHGLLHRTAQDIVLRTLRRYFAPRSFQYTHRGVSDAVRAVKKAIAAGHVYTARLDIIEFFVSFTLEELMHELPLSNEVVEHAVVGRYMKVVMDQEVGSKIHTALPHTQKNLLHQARLGIPQGSGCSPQVGMFCMSRLRWSDQDGVALLNYADDFLLIAVSRQLVEEGVGMLSDAVASLPGGHFTLRVVQESRARRGFEFLGHGLQVIDGALKTWPSAESLSEFEGKLASLDRRLAKALFSPGGKPDKQAGLDCLARMMALVVGWQEAFSECDDLGRYLEGAKNAIADGCLMLDVTPEHVALACTSDMIYRPSHYTMKH